METIYHIAEKTILHPAFLIRFLSVSMIALLKILNTLPSIRVPPASTYILQVLEDHILFFFLVHISNFYTSKALYSTLTSILFSLMFLIVGYHEMGNTDNVIGLLGALAGAIIHTRVRTHECR